MDRIPERGSKEGRSADCHFMQRKPSRGEGETQGKSGQYFVFVVPVNAGLDLKKAAKTAGEKSIAMIKQKDLLPLTGYVHGGCSPIGMKKQFPTFIHETAAGFEHVYVSAGKVGMQVELAPRDLIKTANCKLADVASYDAPEA